MADTESPNRPESRKLPAQQVGRGKDGRLKPGVHLNPDTEWRSGQSGNPHGRPAAGAAVVEWMNIFQDSPEAEIRKVADDQDASVNKRTAARRWLAAVKEAGKDNPERSSRDAASFVCDYTRGRPRQSIEQHLTSDWAETRRPVDISKLTHEEQDQLWGLLERISSADGENLNPAG